MVKWFWQVVHDWATTEEMSVDSGGLFGMLGGTPPAIYPRQLGQGWLCWRQDARVQHGYEQVDILYIYIVYKENMLIFR